LKQIKDLETLQQQINIATDLKSNLIYETTQLQDEKNNLKKILKVILAGITICSFQRRIKTEIYEKEKRLEQLNKLVQDIYNLEAFQKLEQNLIDNIENAIL